MDDQTFKLMELQLKRDEYELKALEYLDKTTESQWSSTKFAVGTLLLGAITAAISFGTLVHTVQRDDQEFLEKNKDAWQEQDPLKRKQRLQQLIARRKDVASFLDAQVGVADSDLKVKQLIEAEERARQQRKRVEAEKQAQAQIAEARQREADETYARQQAEVEAAARRRRADQLLREIEQIKPRRKEVF